jgi:hypothetical protein
MILLFGSFTIFLYSIVSIVSAVLLYGITGVYYLPAWTLTPLNELLPPALSTSTTGLLAGIFRTLDSVFAEARLL